MPERYQHLYELISSDKFLKKQGQANEVPFFICPFDSKETVEFLKMQKQLANRLAGQGIGILEINLYDLSIEILKQRVIWQDVLEKEALLGKQKILELLQGVLDASDHLIPAIKEKMKHADFKVMFISGVGEVFPYIRSHNVLNNLQRVAKDQPTVMFFPGVYTQTLEKGASLDLFGKLHDDKYYRAFNIYHCEV
ncbi:MAG: DUF1788 domain-containing protein [Deltaproteobacteria bacterium]|nr:DUF1788 domain-containing protein [Deltaproteobacteria bacterium]